MLGNTTTENLLELSATIRARADFERARRKAALNNLLAALAGAPRRRRLAVLDTIPSGGIAYRGIRQVPVACIIGTLNREHDFDRDFQPTQSHTRQRWERLAAAAIQGETLPPVQLVQVGDDYYVKDGHHRVSVAHTQGIEFLDAEVVEYLPRTNAPLCACPLHR